MPDPLTDSSGYCLAIAEIVRTKHIDVIFPMTEQSVYCLNRLRGTLDQQVILACASPEKMESVSNKYKLFQLAEKLGVAIPETIYVSDTDDFKKKCNHISSFPVVVKPAFSKIQEHGKMLSAGVMYAKDKNELQQLYLSNPALRYPSMIQEMIVGEGTGLFTLFDHDHHLALFSHRRILEKPPSGGVSVLSESVVLDDEMVGAARKLLSSIQWNGIAMVEFKRDVKDGRAKLMEINGRFWGSLQLAISSGVNFPALCLDYYLGKKPSVLLKDYTVGHKLKWSLGMLDHLIIRIVKRNQFVNLPPGTPSCWQIIMNLLKCKSPNTADDVFDKKDLWPMITEIKIYIRTILRID